jgi:hypothetical protein
MDKNKLFNFLKRQRPSKLIRLLNVCYDCMSAQEICDVFGAIENKLIKLPIVAKSLLNKIRKFRSESLQGKYFAPFDVNSKNFMEIPKETDAWFEKLGKLLTESSQLSKQGDHINAVKCFRILFELVDKLGSVDIVFADELGMWMLPIRVEPCLRTYFRSAAAILEPEEYVDAVLPIILYYNSSGMSTAYESAKRSANERQEALLDEKINQNKKKP